MGKRPLPNLITMRSSISFCNHAATATEGCHATQGSASRHRVVCPTSTFSTASSPFAAARQSVAAPTDPGPPPSCHGPPACLTRCGGVTLLAVTLMSSTNHIRSDQMLSPLPVSGRPDPQLLSGYEGTSHGSVLLL